MLTVIYIACWTMAIVVVCTIIDMLVVTYLGVA